MIIGVVCESVCVLMRVCGVCAHACACSVKMCVRASLQVYTCLCVCLQEGLCDIAFHVGYIREHM